MNYALEKFDDAIAEMMPLLEQHYKEIEVDQDIALNINKDRYSELCNAGAVKVFTVRNDGDALVGYAVFFLQPNMHYQESIQALTDVIYILPQYRGFGAKFISWCDGQLKEMGVQVTMHSVAIKHDFSSMLIRQGYRLVDKVYAKRLDKNE